MKGKHLFERLNPYSESQFFFKLFRLKLKPCCSYSDLCSFVFAYTAKCCLKTSFWLLMSPESTFIWGNVLPHLCWDVQMFLHVRTSFLPVQLLPYLCLKPGFCSLILHLYPDPETVALWVRALPLCNNMTRRSKALRCVPCWTMPGQLPVAEAPYGCLRSRRWWWYKNCVKRWSVYIHRHIERGWDRNVKPVSGDLNQLKYFHHL